MVKEKLHGIHPAPAGGKESEEGPPRNFGARQRKLISPLSTFGKRKGEKPTEHLL